MTDPRYKNTFDKEVKECKKKRQELVKSNFCLKKNKLMKKRKQLIKKIAIESILKKMMMIICL